MDNRQVMKVRGLIAPEELGVTLKHEHILLDMVREFRLGGMLLVDNPRRVVIGPSPSRDGS